MIPVPSLRTPGRIAAELREPLGRVLYVLRTRPHIQPSARAGVIRLFDRRAVAQIRHELTRWTPGGPGRGCPIELRTPGKWSDFAAY